MHCIQPSPCGPLRLDATDNTITGLGFAPDTTPALAPASPLLREACRQLDAYFAGRLHCFSLPLAPRGTPFQLQVWQALQQIPWSERCSYGDIATAIGNPNAVRAVGAANGRNPIAIIIPCHRVIGADGRLTGYAGGLERKRWLLNHEASG